MVVRAMLCDGPPRLRACFELLEAGGGRTCDLFLMLDTLVCTVVGFRSRCGE